MKVSQIYDLVNQALRESVGDTVVLSEDLSNLVDAGKALATMDRYDNYTHALTNVIGRDLYAYRPYTADLRSLLKRSWEYGSILRKIRVDLMDAEENPAWQLVAGQSYDPNVFTPPVAHEKFWNYRTTFQIPISLSRRQVKESFRSVEAMDSFLGMVIGMVNNSLEKATENMNHAALNNFIGELINANGASCRHLLTDYNLLNGGALTASDALVDPDFLRYATAEMLKYPGRLGSYNRLYNLGATDKHTPAEKLHFVMHDEFLRQSEVYLYSDVYHDQFVKLPPVETIPYWQGTGDASSPFSWDETSKIIITTSEGNTVNQANIIAIMFDDEAVCVCNEEELTTSLYNPVGDFTNFWHKRDAGYINDFDEQGIVFLLD